MPKNEDYVAGGSDSGNKPASAMVDELRKSFRPPGAGAPVTPAERVEDALAQVQNAIREQQMCSEQDLQNSLSEASTHVADSQAVDTLFALSQQIASLVAQGDPALQNERSKASELISQLGEQLAMQQAKADRQVAMALQQAVSSMSSAQNAMFQSMSISEMQQLVKGASQVIRDISTEAEVQ